MFLKVMRPVTTKAAVMACTEAATHLGQGQGQGLLQASQNAATYSRHSNSKDTLHDAP